jgi:hypothetical protein
MIKKLTSAQRAYLAEVQAAEAAGHSTLDIALLHMTPEARAAFFRAHLAASLDVSRSLR